MQVYQWKSEYDSLEKRINLLSISIYYIDLLHGYKRLWWNGYIASCPTLPIVKKPQIEEIILPWDCMNFIGLVEVWYV